MNGELPYRLIGPFSHRVDQRSPQLESRVDAIALQITDLVADGESVAFMLRVAIGLDGELFCWFQHIAHAVVVSVEEPDTRRAASFRLIDPERSYLEETVANYRPKPGPRQPSPVFTTGFVNAPIQVRCRAQRDPSERPWSGLWVQASLQTLRSARVHVHPRS